MTHFGENLVSSFDYFLVLVVLEKSSIYERRPKHSFMLYICSCTCHTLSPHVIAHNNLLVSWPDDLKSLAWTTRANFQVYTILLAFRLNLKCGI